LFDEILYQISLTCAYIYMCYREGFCILRKENK
jgi:hypothetical protein